MRTNTKARQHAVYWPPEGVDKDSQRKFATPVERRVRWEDGQLDVTDEGGRMWRSSAQVSWVSPMGEDGRPTVDAEEGGFFRLGRFSTLANPAVPTDNTDAAQIQRVGRVPTRRGRQVYVTAYL